MAHTRETIEEMRFAVADRPRAFYTFTVEGVFEFPFDMLRYDCCWPSSERETAAMLDTHAVGQRRVKLDSFRHPTIERWRSFGWHVVTN